MDGLFICHRERGVVFWGAGGDTAVWTTQPAAGPAAAAQNVTTRPQGGRKGEY